MWFCRLSFGSKTAAIPPCACQLAESLSFFFVIKSTCPYLAACRAKFNPAAPDPIMRKSVFMRGNYSLSCGICLRVVVFSRFTWS